MGIVTIEEREALNEAVRGQSALTTAMFEDEAVRVASEKRSKEYLNKAEEDDRKMPFWMWAILWFILGMFFDMTVTNVGMRIGEWMNG